MELFTSFTQDKQNNKTMPISIGNLKKKILCRRCAEVKLISVISASVHCDPCQKIVNEEEAEELVKRINARYEN